MASRLFASRRGAHSPSSAPDRLRALGRLSEQRPLAPALGGSSERWRPRGGGAARYVVAGIVVVVVVIGAVQLLRPLPSARFQVASTVAVRVPGTPPALPWPATGAAALSETGVGSLGRSGPTTALPVASIAKVLTAYVVLRDHPLPAGSQGPAIAVSPAVVADYQSGLAAQQSEVQVADGESLTELQALQGLLIASGNDMALLLADWDAGTESAFVAKENSEAKSLGLTGTHITDPSGFDPGTVSDTADLIRLGEAAMAIPAFSQIVGMGQVTLPLAGLVYNYDYDVGHDGIVGIKTGSDSSAGGCFLFDAQQAVSGQNVTLVGVVLAQQGASELTAALDDAESLVSAAVSSMRALPVVAPGQHVGSVVAPWGASVPVTAHGSPEIVTDPGVTLRATVRRLRLGSSVGSGARAGTLAVVTPGRSFDVTLRTSGALPGPSLWWRLTNF